MSIETATAAFSTAMVCGGRMLAAAANSTKANSPACDSASAKSAGVGGGCSSRRAARSSRASRSFSATMPNAMPRTRSGARRKRPRSTDMPTAMKNRPSSSPLNGSMSSSSSWRYSLSASITPARKAPSASDRPTRSMSAAVPSTSSSAKPTNTSRRRVSATIPQDAAAPARARAAISSDDHARAPCAAVQPRCQLLGLAAQRSASTSEQRDDGEVLEQQHGERRLAAGRLQQVLLAEVGEADRRRRHRDAHARDQRRPPAAARARAAIAATRGGVAATCTPPRPKIARRSAQTRCGVELQADEEQQQHHAELGEVQHRLRIGDERRPHGPIATPATR